MTLKQSGLGSPHLIVVAYALAPGPGGPEARVNLELMRALARHWDGTVGVISGGREPTLADGEPLSHLPGWSTHTLPTLDEKRYPTALSRFLKRAARASRTGSIPAKVVNRLAFVISGQAARMLSWDLAAASALDRETVAHPDAVVWSRALPWASIQTALRLRERRPFHWILNINDPMPPGLWHDLMPVSRRHDRSIRHGFRRALALTDAVTFPCAQLRQLELDAFPEMEHFPTPILPHVIPRSKRQGTGNQGATGDMLRIGYAGNLRRNRQRPEFQAGLERIRETSPRLLDDIEIRFFLPRTDARIEQYISDLPVRTAMEIGPSFDLSNEDVVLELSSESDRPLLLTKIVHYLATERPIWALTEEGGTSWTILERMPGGYPARLGDAREVETSLRRIHRDWKSGALDEYRPPRDLVARFSSRRHVRDLQSLLAAVTRHPPGESRQLTLSPPIEDWP